MLGLIPIHDENPARRTPLVTYAIIAVNVVAFFISPITISLSGEPTSQAAACEQIAFLREYAAIPTELTSNDPLDQTAGEPAPGGCVAVRPDYDKTPALSVLTAMFLHGGLLHLAGNMLFLWVFGNNIEDRLGHVRYLLFYLLSGYVATYVFAFANASSTTPLVGASGAIAGVLGAYLVLFPRARVTSLVPFLFFLPFQLPAWAVLGSWFLLQYFYASGGGVSGVTSVAYLAHVAGFLAGIGLVLLLGGRRPHRPPPPDWRRWDSI